MTILKVTSVCLVVSAIAVFPMGCDEYERDQLRQAGEDIDSAGSHVGEASGSAFDRARNNTGDALRNLGDKIDTRNDDVNDAADQD